MSRSVILVALALFGFALSAAAQNRSLPADAARGFIRHVHESLVSVDGKMMRLAPGATIRDRGNLIIVPTSLPADGAVAEYLTDVNGQISRVWLLTPAEAARAKPKK